MQPRKFRWVIERNSITGNKLNKAFRRYNKGQSAKMARAFKGWIIKGFQEKHMRENLMINNQKKGKWWNGSLQPDCT